MQIPIFLFRDVRVRQPSQQAHLNMGDAFAPVLVPRPGSLTNPLRLHQEASFWRSVGVVAKHQFEAPVTHVSFSPVAPYDVAASAGFSVELIGSRAGTKLRSLSRFRDFAYSPHYKPDGNLLVAGDAGGRAKVFDLGSRAVLREFKGHQGAVRTAMFSRDGHRVMTGSDDTVVKAWDLATSQLLLSLKDSKDYVRCQSSSPVSQHAWMAGSLDRKARLYDLRTGRCLFTLDHEYQVDDVHILPGGTRAVTIGGPEVRIWDFFTGGKMIHKLTSHAKAVTSCAVDSSGHMLATAGLDGVVKVHNLDTFRAKGRMHFTSEILSLDVSRDGVKYAVGMADGNVEVRSVKTSGKYVSSVPQSTARREREFEGYGRGFEKVHSRVSGPKPGSRRYFERGVRADPAEDLDFVMKEYRRPKLADYDRSLQKFNHGEALDQAVNTGKPIIVTSVVEELMTRGALTGALAGRDPQSLNPILGVIQRNIRKPLYTKRLTQLLNAIVDIYGAEFGQDSEMDQRLSAILNAVQREVRECRSLAELQGAAQTILSASSSVS